MAKSPDKRFRNAQVMARALDPIACRLLPSSRLGALVKKTHRPGALIAVGMGAALVLGALLFPALRSRQDEALTSPATQSEPGLSIPPEAVAPGADEQSAQL